MIGFIGGGNMAAAMIKGMTGKGMKDILVSEPDETRRIELERAFGVKTTASNNEVVRECSLVILAVKPQVMDEVLAGIADDVRDDTTVVSIAAGITLSYLKSKLKTEKIIRVMSNTPALVSEGMSVYSLCECVTGKEIDTVRSILMTIGSVKALPESKMNAVTALSGSGPAFIAFFIEAMIEAGKTIGLEKDEAFDLAIQTVHGTSTLLYGGMSPETLRRMVTSPGGTTAAGLGVFEVRDLKGIVSAALQAASERAEELGRKT